MDTISRRVLKILEGIDGRVNIDMLFQKKSFRHLFTFVIKALTNTDVTADWLILRILHQSFEKERHRGH